MEERQQFGRQSWGPVHWLSTWLSSAHVLLLSFARFPICKVGQVAQLLPASQVLQKDKVTNKLAKAVKLILITFSEGSYHVLFLFLIGYQILQDNTELWQIWMTSKKESRSQNSLTGCCQINICLNTIPKVINVF